ncbi:unnamed protein product [Bursaphelenchus okinawaensis]|uniref:Rhodanese domain-containing protein n=1 Tax=Bursaphelenchus okinawaensis TaxID=465554 RepID=A0A811LBY9_9BILA|nr:unnamed protein product [Bursaphelenchus okinawaensis]CAG9120178.1 unnamed protein product [Bursaphelenchus okinawaensis]
MQPYGTSGRHKEAYSTSGRNKEPYSTSGMNKTPYGTAGRNTEAFGASGRSTEAFGTSGKKHKVYEDRVRSPPESYCTVEDQRRNHEYEDYNYGSYYEEPPALPKRNRPPAVPSSVHSLSPRSLPTPLAHSTLQRLHYPEDRRKQDSCSKSGMVGAGFVVITLVTIVAVVLVLWHAQAKMAHNVEEVEDKSTQRLIQNDVTTVKSPQAVRSEFVISPNYLVTLIITKRKVCLFEVTNSEAKQSEEDFIEEHIQSAQLLYFSNLSHSGVPVHPLQFQRHIRRLGVDEDCHVVLYDRGQVIWSTYAFWIFKLFGHEKLSVLNGGFAEWKMLSTRPKTLYKLDKGPSPVLSSGNFKARWDSDLIMTFDDVIVNFDERTHDIVDAQNEDEYNGKIDGAVFGHMRGSVNIPIDAVYDWHNNTWPSDYHQREFFTSKGLNTSRPVFIYDGTSLRSTMVWFALERLRYQASIYFGSWPEFVIRAPDILKILPDGAMTP